MMETIAALAFYAGVVPLVVGTIAALRASVERNVTDRRAIALAGAGLACIAAAIPIFLRSGRSVLPF